MVFERMGCVAMTNAKMNGNSWQFTHANGAIKPRRVPKLEDSSKEGAAKAPAKKK